jgi:hypothetical protein
VSTKRSCRSIARRRVLQAGVALGCACAARAFAAVHKCVAPGGTVYQDQPCGAGTPDRDGELADAPLSVLPAPAPAHVIERRAPTPKPSRPERARRREPQREGNPAERRHLRVGMSEGEVIARVGPPDLTTGRGRRQVRWTWMPVPGDPDTITVVLFDVGRAIEVERTLVKR